MNLKHLFIALALMAMVSCSKSSQESTEESSEDMTDQPAATDDTADDGVYFEALQDGDIVTAPVIVKMGVRGMQVEPAGEVHEGMGHHHIIIDGSFVEEGQMVPADATHIHFGKGQTVDTLALAPGNHTITLQFANGIHSSYGEAWSKTIGVMVQ